MRVLVCIANHGEDQLHHLDRVLREWAGMSHDVEVVLHTTVEVDETYGGLLRDQQLYPESIGVDLPFEHRETVARGRGDHDLYVYTENDVLVTQDNLEALLEAHRRLPDDHLAGFLRYEEDEAGRRILPDLGATSPTLGPFGLTYDGGRWFRPLNVHQGCWVLRDRQLDRAIESGGFRVEPHRTRHQINPLWPPRWYGRLESGASDPYTQCGFAAKVLPADGLEDLLVEHLSGHYARSMAPEAIVTFEELRELARSHRAATARHWARSWWLFVRNHYLR